VINYQTILPRKTLGVGLVDAVLASAPSSWRLGRAIYPSGFCYRLPIAPRRERLSSVRSDWKIIKVGLGGSFAAFFAKLISSFKVTLNPQGPILIPTALLVPAMVLGYLLSSGNLLSRRTSLEEVGLPIEKPRPPSSIVVSKFEFSPVFEKRKETVPEVSPAPISTKPDSSPSSALTPPSRSAREAQSRSAVQPEVNVLDSAKPEASPGLPGLVLPNPTLTPSPAPASQPPVVPDRLIPITQKPTPPGISSDGGLGSRTDSGYQNSGAESQRGRAGVAAGPPTSLAGLRACAGYVGAYAALGDALALVKEKSISCPAIGGTFAGRTFTVLNPSDRQGFSVAIATEANVLLGDRCQELELLKQCLLKIR
jgi:hypothetical protein